MPPTEHSGKESVPAVHDALRVALFPGDNQYTYAVLDGASCEDLLEKLDELQPESICLYAGELKPDVAEVAPYLVALSGDHRFTAWLLTGCVGRHWGIFARSPQDFRTLRKHFRTFLLVRSPEGRKLYFRYYDPRILRAYLPTCNSRELSLVFGPVTSYLVEEELDGNVAEWSLSEGIAEKRLLLAAATM